MSKLQIITNNQWRPFKYRYEVPEKVLKSEFDYQDGEEVFDGFFCYRGTWYHLDQFTAHRAPWGCIPADSPLAAWHAHLSDSFFSGVVIRVTDDGEMYQVGTYFS